MPTWLMKLSKIPNENKPSAYQVITEFSDNLYRIQLVHCLGSHQYFFKVRAYDHSEDWYLINWKMKGE